ncbi:hypothetical protein [Methanosarcina mazei]|uniref:hypothetical protein n=1 Tax=Methanosarcina mazei TaxID=2209 RepID=UPI00064E6E08|nr:hypothetical protein [Methanosarcina mazei]
MEWEEFRQGDLYVWNCKKGYLPDPVFGKCWDTCTSIIGILCKVQGGGVKMVEWFYGFKITINSSQLYNIGFKYLNQLIG